MVAVCPHANSEGFEGECPDSVWLEGDLELMRRCDAVILVDGWQKSQGTLAEIDLAHAIGLPIFTSIDELVQWAEPATRPVFPESPPPESVRPEVEAFSLEMEHVLCLNDRKGGWQDSALSYLLLRMREQLCVLSRAISSESPALVVRREAADVANFAMMLWDNVRTQQGNRRG
jgi:hypothetical protein